MNVSEFKYMLRKLPWGLLGMLGLVIGGERFVQRHETTFMTPHELDWEAGGRNAEQISPRVEVLCYGDSMLKFGLSPRILEQQLGRSVFSLALLDGKPAASYFLLRRSIESGARPRLVLVDFQPECMYQTPRSLTENRHLKALLDVRESIDLARVFHDPDLVAEIALSRVFPSYKCRTEIRAGVGLALEGRANPNPEENAKVRRNRALNRGGMLLAKMPAYNGDVPPRIAEILFSEGWFNRPEHTSYVRRFMDLAERHHIPVLWVLPPNTPKAQEGKERVGLDGRYTRFLQNVQSRYANLTVVDARRSGFGHEMFVDSVHLDREGATIFSLAMAEVLRPRLDPARSSKPPLARWESVPRALGATTRIALEDVDQSRVKVREAFQNRIR